MNSGGFVQQPGPWVLKAYSTLTINVLDQSATTDVEFEKINCYLKLIVS